MFFALLIRMLNFVPIGYYLRYDLYNYILCRILNYKTCNLKNFLMTLLLIFNFLEILQV